MVSLARVRVLDAHIHMSGPQIARSGAPIDQWFPREALINAVLGEDVPGGMRRCHCIWCVYWMSVSTCRGARSPDPVRRSQNMIDQWFPNIWRMQLHFSVGEQEQHRVTYRFNEFWKNLSISVDGHVITKDVVMFSMKLTHSHRFTIGDRDSVQINRTRALLLAGFRPEPVRACVNGVQVAEGVA